LEGLAQAAAHRRRQQPCRLLLGVNFCRAAGLAGGLAQGLALSGITQVEGADGFLAFAGHTLDVGSCKIADTKSGSYWQLVVQTGEI
jgi:hypothetical protein